MSLKSRSNVQCMGAARAVNNIHKDRPVVIPTADDPRSNSTVGAGGDSSAFVKATVEGSEEDPFLSVMVEVVVPLLSVLENVEVVLIISATSKLDLMTRS